MKDDNKERQELDAEYSESSFIAESTETTNELWEALREGTLNGLNLAIDYLARQVKRSEEVMGKFIDETGVTEHWHRDMLRKMESITMNTYLMLADLRLTREDIANGCK